MKGDYRGIIPAEGWAHPVNILTYVYHINLIKFLYSVEEKIKRKKKLEYLIYTRICTCMRMYVYV